MKRYALSGAVFTALTLGIAPAWSQDLPSDALTMSPPPFSIASTKPVEEPQFWVDTAEDLQGETPLDGLQLATADAPIVNGKPFSAVNDEVAKRKAFWAENSPEESRWVTEEQFEKQLKLIHKEVPDNKIGLFGPDSMMWKVNSYLSPGGFGAGQALLLQISHPWITAGIDEHSAVRDKPLERGRNTFRYILTMLYGSREQALQAAKDVRRIHEKVQGHMRYRAGAFAKDSEYRANEEAAMVWVHSTLWYTQMKMYEESVSEVSDVDKERYYQESKLFAYLFGIREEALPDHWLDFVAYVEKTKTSDTLVVTRAASQLADYLFGVHGVGSALLWPAMQLQITITKANLPERINKGYGFSDYTWFGKSVYASTMFGSRAINTIMPDFLIQNPAYKEAKARIKGKKAGWLTRFGLYVAFGNSRLTNDK